MHLCACVVILFIHLMLCVLHSARSKNVYSWDNTAFCVVERVASACNLLYVLFAVPLSYICEIHTVLVCNMCPCTYQISLYKCKNIDRKPGLMLFSNAAMSPGKEPANDSYDRITQLY